MAGALALPEGATGRVAGVDLRAREHGVPRLYSFDAATNEPMRRLARDLGFSEQPDPDDIHQVIYARRP